MAITQNVFLPRKRQNVMAVTSSQPAMWNICSPTRWSN